MSGFKVSIINGQVSILCEDEVPETDIIDLLEFDESQMEDLFRDHAAIQARWEQIAINLRNQYDLFIDEFEKKWWAHNKNFARYILEGYGEKKPTIDTIKDTVILVYSGDTVPIEREKYGEVAYRAAVSKDASYKDAKVDFLKIMFKYVEMNPAWTYEALVRTSKSLEKNVLTAQNIAKRLDNRSYHMKELKDLVMAKHGNLGPMTSKDQAYERATIQKIKGYEPGGKR